jgi:galactose mutarotase-like enzyme
MNDTTERYTIAAGGLQASILAQGAELCSLHDTDEGEMLWQAGPAWPRHAPVLFPIVGRLQDDTLLHNGTPYHLTQHGFARDRRFRCTAQSAAVCTLELVDDAATRAMYPFAFRFSLTFRIAEGWLEVAHAVTNTGNATLPVNMGGHPAFRWPLADGVAKSAHILTFSAEETAPLQPILGGLLGPATTPSPIVNRVLKLDDAVFAADALVLAPVQSRSVRFTAPGAPGLEMEWFGFPDFGVWMRPPGAFLCLEPWLGTASSVGWQGEFATKPGIATLAPGATLDAMYRVRVLPKE